MRTALLSGDNGCLRRSQLQPFIDWCDWDSLPEASLADLLRVHEYSYLKHLESKSQEAVRREGCDYQEKPSFYAPGGNLDCDTPLSPQSLTAAKRFCGAAMLAVDYVMDANSRANHMPGQAEYDRAFVIGRPPGHHAGPNGCVPSEFFWQRPDMTSSGFCLLNTVAVAAAYARYQYSNRNSPSVSQSSGLRIAIVDIDIHHGNGTEEIVRNLIPHEVCLPLPSSWAPVSRLSYKPWLNENDDRDTFFSSIHLYGGKDPSSNKQLISCISCPIAS